MNPMSLDQFSWWFEGFIEGCNGREFTPADFSLIHSKFQEVPTPNQHTLNLLISIFNSIQANSIQ